MGNDFGFETYFERQVKAHGREGDLLVCISTGGGDKKSNASMNIACSNRSKKNRYGNYFIDWKGGGELKELSDIDFHIPSKTSFIQEHICQFCIVFVKY